MTVRSKSNGDEAKQQLLDACSDNNQNGQIDYLLMDLGDLTTVQQMAIDFKKKYNQLDYLINNAGVMVCPHNTTKQGFEIQFGTNHLGHFLLTILLIDMIKSSSGRIVNVSSAAARYFVKEGDEKTFCSFTQNSVTGNCEEIASKNQLYGRSKLANILFTKKLARELNTNNSNATAYSVHPGMVKTNLQRHVHGVLNLVVTMLNVISKSPIQGAQSTLYVTLTPKNELTNGGFYEECKKEDGSIFADNKNLQDALWETSMKLVAPYLPQNN